MRIQNGLALLPDGQFARMDVEVENGRIARLAPQGELPPGPGRDIDATGCYVLPGFVDMHTHGAIGCDFGDADAEGLRKLLSFYVGRGVTTVLGTLASAPLPAMREALATAGTLLGRDDYGAVMRGMRLEGPFLNPVKQGGQNGAAMCVPDTALLQELQALCGEGIRVVDVAPELPGAVDFIRETAGKTVVSLAHTVADYDLAVEALEAGATHVTHLFSAMEPLLHRLPGPVGAAGDFARHVEVIADGVHMHPSVVRLVFRAFAGRVCLVSDSMRGAGLPDGDYAVDGQSVRVEKGKATLPNGTLAGSTADLAECCRRAIGFGVPVEEALMAATLHPAKAAGLDAEVGSLATGKRADVVLWGPDFALREVLAGGRQVPAPEKTGE